MDKYHKRVQNEFEKILIDLSYEPSTCFNDAYKKALEYTDTFANKKHLTKYDRELVLDHCVELIHDWFPQIYLDKTF